MGNPDRIADITLRTDNLDLKHFCEKDLLNLFQGLSNAEVIKYYGVSYNSLESSKHQLQWFEELQELGKGIWWAIFNRYGVFHGAIGFNNFNPEQKKIELGFWLLPEFWGKGIASEAINLVVAYAFETLKVYRIEAFVELENQNSSKVLLKNSFSYEGTMINCEIKNSEFISLMIYARFR